MKSAERAINRLVSTVVDHDSTSYETKALVLSRASVLSLHALSIHSKIIPLLLLHTADVPGITVRSKIWSVSSPQ